MSIVKSFSVGNGDMYYIKHDSDNFTIIDCCMPEEREEAIIKELKKQLNVKKVSRFISTHPDDDHIKGIECLFKKINILNFYAVNNKTKKKEDTDDFKKYKSLIGYNKICYLEKNLKRCWLNKKNEKRDGSGINILWPDTNNRDYKDALKKAAKGDSPNNISPIIQYSEVKGVNIIWMGDLETNFIDKILDYNKLVNDISKKSILFAPHHGRNSGKILNSWIDKIKPKLIIIGEAPSKDLNYYDGFNTIKQNTAGDILLDCTEDRVRIYVGNNKYHENFLKKEGCVESNNFGLYYLRTL
ncbi:MAG: MBL fold metallo-hydrolase [Proteobacteria bacterium]|nr:MBL fold metallo-hydrolase [Pseudomonadota bacterium]